MIRKPWTVAFIFLAVVILGAETLLPPGFASNISKHKFQSAKPDGGDASVVRPSNWNDEHAFAGGNNGALLYRDTAQSDGASWLQSVAAGSYVRSSGVAAAPTWSTVTIPNTAATGDVWYGSASNAISALAAGSPGHVLTMGATTPTWSAPLYPEQGRLTKVGNNLAFCPYKGNKLIINSVARTIPDACVTLAPTGASSGTTYNIYAFMSGSTMTLEYATTTHTIQAGTGVEIQLNNATRSLVGMARAIAGPAWSDIDAKRFVLSWANRRAIHGTSAFLATYSTTTTTTTEVNQEIRVEFLTWGEEDFWATLHGDCYNDTTNKSCRTWINLDGTNQEGVVGGFTANNFYPFSISLSRTTPDGYHYITLFGGVDGGTGFWRGAGVTNPRTALHVLVRG